MGDCKTNPLPGILGWGFCVKEGEDIISVWWSADSPTPTLKVRRVPKHGGP